MLSIQEAGLDHDDLSCKLIFAARLDNDCFGETEGGVCVVEIDVEAGVGLRLWKAYRGLCPLLMPHLQVYYYYLLEL